jgi:hypothetical protein
MTNERIVWKGRESLWNSSTGVLFIFGSALILISIPFLRALVWFSIITMLGLFLVICGYYSFKRFSTYVITNKRLVEIKKGKIEKEVSLDEIVKAYEPELAKLTEGVIDLTLLFLGEGVPGLIPSLLGIGSLYIKNKEGKIVFKFKRVKVKVVKNKLAEVIKEIYCK